MKWRGTKHDYERLDRLKRRRNWLWNRIYQAEKEGGKVLHWDKAEAGALDWAIDIIEGLEKNEEIKNSSS